MGRKTAAEWAEFVAEVLALVHPPNQVICVSGRGGKTDFSCLVTETAPDAGLVGATQVFPRYTYPDGDR